MTNKTKIIIGVGSAIALVASYLIYKKMSSDKGEENPPKKGEENPPKKGEENTATNNSECKKYIVSNVSNSVNVRSTPSTSLKEITTLNKNSVVSAKPSSVNGWMELCDMKGFISSQYLKPFVSKSTKCVLQKGLKWGEDIFEGEKYYRQNYKDLRNGFWYTRSIDTNKPYDYFEGAWYRRTDNKDKGDASWGRNNVYNGKLDPNSVINIKEAEQFYQSGNVC